MAAQIQEENKFAFLIDDHVVFPKQNFTIHEAKALAVELRELLKSCNVAIPFNPTADLFQTADSGSVFTTFINDEEEYNSARVVFSLEREAIVPVIAAIMNFHSTQEGLNIIIAQEVMERHAKSYMTYTGQFANQISKQTQEFLNIRVIFDAERKQCGIFCRKSEFEMSATFRGQLLGELKTNKEAIVPIQAIPETYVLYPSTLLSHLRKRLPEYDVILTKTKTNFKFAIKNKS